MKGLEHCEAKARDRLDCGVSVCRATVRKKNFAFCVVLRFSRTKTDGHPKHS
jgi:hypothetical protein